MAQDSDNSGSPAPRLFTPGPLTTAPEVRRAMLRDWGSRDAEFIDMTARIRARLKALVDGDDDFTVVPIQGSGTFAVEAMIGTLVPPDGKVLVLQNGAYGKRMVDIAERLGRAFRVMSWAEDEAIDAGRVEAALARDRAVTHVGVVHVETTSGVVNPIAEIAEAVAAAGRRCLIDAMSAFGALPLDARGMRFEAVAASANKCLESTPGVAFVIADVQAIKGSARNAPSLALDLHDQWRSFEATGEWRFTPPTHVVAALDAALDRLDREGGVPARGARYRRNCARLRDGFVEIGFQPYLDEAVQSPIILTLLAPADPRYAFAPFYDGLRARGLAIYPGKITQTPSFRVGCIGALEDADFDALLAGVREVLAEMGVRNPAPPADR